MGERKGAEGVITAVMWLLGLTKGNLVGPGLVGWMKGKMLKVSLQSLLVVGSVLTLCVPRGIVFILHILNMETDIKLTK